MIDTLKQLREIMGDTYKDLLEAYLDDCPKKLEQMQSAFRDIDFETLTFTAHSMKGSSYTLGAHKLAEVCEEIEMLARSNSIKGLAGKIVELKQIYQDVKITLEQEIFSL